MNYQSSLDAYYAYTNENIEIEKKERKNIFSWALLSIVVLLLVSAYIKYIYMPGIEGVQNTFNKTNTSSVTLVDTVNKKLPIQPLPTSIQTIEKPTIAPTIKKPEKSMESSTQQTTKLSTQNLTSSKSIESSEALTNQALLKSTDKNTLIVKELTASQVTSSKVKEELPLDLYHLYIVSKGESIYQIAKRQYGDTEMYIEIVNANPDLDNPNSIRAGQELLLPIVDESKSYSEILNFR